MSVRTSVRSSHQAMFTDGYTPWPDIEPEYPLIVCCTTDTEVPIGMDIRI